MKPLGRLRLRAMLGAGLLAGSGSVPASPPARPAGRAMPGLRLTATPEPVPPGATITYRVPGGRGMPIAPDLTLHLPVGTTHARTSGSGWTCELPTRPADPQQAGEHLEAVCSSLRMGLIVPALIVKVEAPQTAGVIRACVVASMKPGLDGPEACVSSTVRPK